MIKEYKPIVENSENLNKIAYSHISSDEFELLEKHPVLYAKNSKSAAKSGLVFLKHKTKNIAINLKFDVDNGELTDFQVCIGSQSVKSNVTVDERLINEIESFVPLSF